MTSAHRRHNPGWFASDRTKLRDLRRDVPGQLAMLLHTLAVEATADGIIKVGHIRELAADLNVGTKWLRSALESLAVAGLIEWKRATNQYADGSIRVLIDVSAPPRARAGAHTHAHTHAATQTDEASRENGTHSEQWTVNSEETSFSPSTYVGGDRAAAGRDLIARANQRRERDGLRQWRNLPSEQSAVAWELDAGERPNRILAVLTLDDWKSVTITPEALATRIARDSAGCCPGCDGSGLWPDGATCAHCNAPPLDISNAFTTVDTAVYGETAR